MRAIYLRKDKVQTIPYKWHISSEIELRCVLSNNSPYTWSLIIHILVSVPFIWVVCVIFGTSLFSLYKWPYCVLEIEILEDFRIELTHSSS